MGKAFEDLRVLLLQARNEPEIEVQEQQCFLERCRLRRAQLSPVSVLRTPLEEGLLDRADALLIGGAGTYSAADDDPWTEALLTLLRAASDRGLPTFGSCWGHQLIARAFGGTVRYDGALAELGCGEVHLTEAGRSDRLFRDFPPSFRANMGHHDRVVTLPPGAVELAYSNTQRNQAFRVAGKPVYGTQFHSELDATRERERLLAYRAFYTEIGTDEDFQRILDALAETTEVDHLLHDFLVKFAVGR